LNITVLFTGGTIGSKSNGSYVDVCRNTTEPLFSHYYDEHKNSDVHFNKKTILNVLSENMNSDYWIKITEEVISLSEKCDGVIVTHGTDTLAYSAAFLSLALHKIQIPVLLVSSDLPLENPKANGYQNFNCAVDFIKNELTKGVFVPVFDGKTNYIHLASRLTQAYAFTHRFESVGGIYYGTMETGAFKWNNAQYNPTLDNLRSAPKFQIDLLGNELREVICIRHYPDFNYDYIDLSKKPAAVLHETYHSGTACVNAEKSAYSVIKFAERCTKENIDLYAAPFDSRKAAYVSVKEMLDANIKIIKDMSFEAAYVKLKIAYGFLSDTDSVIDFMNRNISFENVFAPL